MRTSSPVLPIFKANTVAVTEGVAVGIWVTIVKAEDVGVTKAFGTAVPPHGNCCPPWKAGVGVTTGGIVPVTGAVVVISGVKTGKGRRLPCAPAPPWFP